MKVWGGSWEVWGELEGLGGGGGGGSWEVWGGGRKLGGGEGIPPCTHWIEPWSCAFLCQAQEFFFCGI